MQKLTDAERERKRLERNEYKRERRRRLREIENFVADGNGSIGRQIEALVAKIAADVTPAAGVDESAVKRMIDDYAASLRQSVVVTIDDVTREIEGRAHKQFAPLLNLCRAKKRDRSRHNVLIVGPAGCGKSYAAQQVANALDLPYGFISLSAGISESHLIGRYIPSGDNGRFEYQESTFVSFYRNGGVFCLDEVDAADENVLLVINAALANGHLRLPDGSSVKRHPDFVCIACANTFGNGADRQYVGRNQLDTATLDRFIACRLVFDYDTDFERAAGREDVCEWAQSLRERVQRSQLRRVVSTRFILDASDLIESGASTLDDVKRSLLLDWSDADLAAVGEARP